MSMTRMSGAQYEARYFISPYQPGDFAGKEPNVVDDRYTKFFESPGQLELGTGRVSSRIDRFDLNEPIVFLLLGQHAAGICPGGQGRHPLLEPRVREGHRAGEKSTGRCHLAPDAKYNIIQWVPWDRAGFAYADVLADPLNGESQHGQV